MFAVSEKFLLRIRAPAFNRTCFFGFFGLVSKLCSEERICASRGAKKFYQYLYEGRWRRFGVAEFLVQFRNSGLITQRTG